jgi:hypothetical protein
MCHRTEAEKCRQQFFGFRKFVRLSAFGNVAYERLGIRTVFLPDRKGKFGNDGGREYRKVSKASEKIAGHEMVRRDYLDVGRIGPVYFVKKSSGGFEVFPLACEKAKPRRHFGKFSGNVKNGVFFFGFGEMPQTVTKIGRLLQGPSVSEIGRFRIQTKSPVEFAERRLGIGHHFFCQRRIFHVGDERTDLCQG